MYPYIFLCAKVYRPTTSGCRGEPYSRRYDRELVSKPAISLKKSWGGYRRTTLKHPTNPAASLTYNDSPAGSGTPTSCCWKLVRAVLSPRLRLTQVADRLTVRVASSPGETAPVVSREDTPLSVTCDSEDPAAATPDDGDTDQVIPDEESPLSSPARQPVASVTAVFPRSVDV